MNANPDDNSSDWGAEWLLRSPTTPDSLSPSDHWLLTSPTREETSDPNPQYDGRDVLLRLNREEDSDTGWLLSPNAPACTASPLSQSSAVFNVPMDIDSDPLTGVQPTTSCPRVADSRPAHLNSHGNLRNEPLVEEVPFVMRRVKCRGDLTPIS